MDTTTPSILQFGAGGSEEFSIDADGEFKEVMNPIPNVFKTFRLRFENSHNNLISRLHE